MASISKSARAGASGSQQERKKVREEPELDARLYMALAHTFPASVPVAVGRATATEPPARPVERKAPVFR